MLRNLWILLCKSFFQYVFFLEFFFQNSVIEELYPFVSSLKVIRLQVKGTKWSDDWEAQAIKFLWKIIPFEDFSSVVAYFYINDVL